MAFKVGDAEARRKLVARIFDKLTLQDDGVRLELALPFQLLAGRAPTHEPASKGANSRSTRRKTNDSGRNRTIDAVPQRSAHRLRCPAGANPKHTTEFPLHKRKNRVVADAKPTRISTWWTLTGSNR